MLLLHIMGDAEVMKAGLGTVECPRYPRPHASLLEPRPLPITERLITLPHSLTETHCRRTHLESITLTGMARYPIENRTDRPGIRDTRSDPGCPPDHRERACLCVARAVLDIHREIPVVQVISAGLGHINVVDLPRGTPMDTARVAAQFAGLLAVGRAGGWGRCPARTPAGEAVGSLTQLLSRISLEAKGNMGEEWVWISQHRRPTG